MIDSKYNKIIYDVLIGSIFVALISYFTLIFDTNPEYLNISAFLWGVPLIYFYFIYVTYQKSSKAMKSFTIHGLIGQALTIIIMIATLFMLLYNYSLNLILLVNIIYALLCLLIYFYYEIYKYF